MLSLPHEVYYLHTNVEMVYNKRVEDYNVMKVYQSGAQTMLLMQCKKKMERVIA